jgi:hypothetical protein
VALLFPFRFPLFSGPLFRFVVFGSGKNRPKRARTARFRHATVLADHVSLTKVHAKLAAALGRIASSVHSKAPQNVPQQSAPKRESVAMISKTFCLNNATLEHVL